MAPPWNHSLNKAGSQLCSSPSIKLISPTIKIPSPSEEWAIRNTKVKGKLKLKLLSLEISQNEGEQMSPEPLSALHVDETGQMCNHGGQPLVPELPCKWINCCFLRWPHILGRVGKGPGDTGQNKIVCVCGLLGIILSPVNLLWGTG